MNTIESSTSARVDLKDTPLDGGEHFYIDGSCSRPSDGVYLCGYAIVTQATQNFRISEYKATEKGKSSLASVSWL